MKTECPHCGQHYEVDEEYIGQVVECTNCGKPFAIKAGSDVATIQAQRPGGKMKALVCEMCGSTDLIKQNGLFVCQSCGIKYSLEEARKMMIDGTVNVAGTVKVDNSASIDNYFKIAKSAFESRNQKEAESYCNKILEIDPENYKAWLLKGKSAGWQSTLGNLRFEEAVNCFMKAIDNAPGNTVILVKKEAADEMERSATAFIKLCCNNYISCPSNDSANALLQSLKPVQTYTLVLFAKCGVMSDGFKTNVTRMINNALVTAWENHVEKEFTEDPHPSKLIWEQFRDRCLASIAIEQATIDLYGDDGQSDIQSYKNLIFLTKELIQSQSWKYDDKVKFHVPDCSLTDEEKNIYIDNMMKWHEKIHEIDPNYKVPPRPKVHALSDGCIMIAIIIGFFVLVGVLASC